MKKTIYKYSLQIIGIQTIEIPYGSDILSLQTQSEEPCIWVLINNIDAVKETIKLRTIGTGHNIVKETFEPKKFIGTYQLSNGFVGHVFKI